MDANNESRLKMQEADILVHKVVTLSNPSRPQIVQASKANQTQQLKFAIAGQNSAELAKCLRDVEEYAANAQRRLEEIEPKSQQLVSIVKFVKEYLTKEHQGMADAAKSEEDRYHQARQELESLREQISLEQEAVQKNIEKTRSQIIQLDMKLKSIPDGQVASAASITRSPEEEEQWANEERTLQMWNDKCSKLIEVSTKNIVDFNVKHSDVLKEIEMVQKSLDEVSAQNKIKQDLLDKEVEKSEELEKAMQEMEKKLASLRE